jgi:hypothetical protein
VIVLDEQLLGRHIEDEISGWYRGSVCFITDLRPGTIIKDDAIPSILRHLRKPAFVTINVSHFWRRVPIDERFCVVCFNFSDSHVRLIPGSLKLLMGHQSFSTKGKRAGHVFRVSLDQPVHFYNSTNPSTQTLQV